MIADLLFGFVVGALFSASIRKKPKSDLQDFLKKRIDGMDFHTKVSGLPAESISAIEIGGRQYEIILRRINDE